MKNEVVVIASICVTNSWKVHETTEGSSFLSGAGYWHTAAANQCLAAIQGLVKCNDKLLVKVLTTAPSDSTFVRALKQIGPDILLTGCALEKTDVVRKAIDGAFGVLLITDVLYDRDSSVSEEVSIGRSVADACLDASIQHVVYFSQMHVYASIGLRSDPCDAKAHVADYLAERNVPKSLVVVPFFYEDFLYGILKPVKMNRSNVYKIVAPTGHIPFDSIRFQDLGNCVRSIFENSSNWAGKTIALSGDKMTLKDYARIMTNETNDKKIEDAQVTPEQFLERSDWDGAEDLANHFDCLTRCVQRNNQVSTRQLHSDTVSFYDWSKANFAVLQQLT